MIGVGGAHVGVKGAGGHQGRCFLGSGAKPRGNFLNVVFKALPGLAKLQDRQKRTQRAEAFLLVKFQAMATSLCLCKKWAWCAAKSGSGALQKVGPFLTPLFSLQKVGSHPSSELGVGGGCAVARQKSNVDRKIFIAGVHVSRIENFEKVGSRISSRVHNGKNRDPTFWFIMLPKKAYTIAEKMARPVQGHPPALPVQPPPTPSSEEG